MLMQSFKKRKLFLVPGSGAAFFERYLKVAIDKQHS
jgi:hypothetical protein